MRKYFLLLVILINTTIYCEGVNKAGFPVDTYGEYYGIHHMEIVPLIKQKDGTLKRKISNKIIKKQTEILKGMYETIEKTEKKAQKMNWKKVNGNEFNMWFLKKDERIYTADFRISYPYPDKMLSIAENGKIIWRNQKDKEYSQYGVWYLYEDRPLSKYKEFYVFTGQKEVSRYGFSEEESEDGIVISKRITMDERYAKAEIILNEDIGWERVSSPNIVAGDFIFKKGNRYVKVEHIASEGREYLPFDFKFYTQRYTFYREELNDVLAKKYSSGNDYRNY